MSGMGIPRNATVSVVVLVAGALAFGIHADARPGHTGLVATGTSTSASAPAATTVPGASPASRATTELTPAALTPAAAAPEPASVTVAPVAPPGVTVAPPAVTVDPGAGPSVIGAQALVRISYPWARLGYQLAFHGPK